MTVIRIILTLLLLIDLSACATKKRNAIGNGFSTSGAENESSDLKPWERFIVGRDLRGGALSNSKLLAGDAEFARAERVKALEQYLSLKPNSLNRLESDALMMRIGAIELSLDKPERALSELSNYFRMRKSVVEDVDPAFSLLFAYAYGRKNNIEQSIAWFSRVMQFSGESYRAEAAQGMRQLLRWLPDTQLDQLETAWKNDSFVRSIFGEERSRRRSAGTTPDLSNYRAPFWESYRSEQHYDTQNSSTDLVGLHKIGVLLPLSGQYAALGQFIKNGLDLAFATIKSDEQIEIVYQDNGPDITSATQAAQELIKNRGVQVIIGPLLSDMASAIVELARENNVPTVVFSKKSDFEIGQGIFRMAPTIEAQIESLIEVAAERGLSKVALVYPEDANGHEAINIFKRRAEEAGLQISFESSYEKNDFDAMIPIAREVELRGVEAVFIPDSIMAASRFFADIDSTHRARIVPLGIATWDNLFEIVRSAAALNRAIFPSLFFSQSKQQSIVDFIAAYQNRFQNKPEFLAAQGFDTGTIVLYALRHQNGGMDLRESLEQIDLYQGVSGNASVQPDGEIHRHFKIVELQDGALHEVIHESATELQNLNQPKLESNQPTLGEVHAKEVHE